jgi:hypothetical protein
MVAWKLVVFDAEDLRHRLAVLAERKYPELASADGAGSQSSCRNRTAAACSSPLPGTVDELLFLGPADRAKIKRR